MAKHSRDFLRVKKHVPFQTQPALHGNLVAANDLPVQHAVASWRTRELSPGSPLDASLPGAWTSHFGGLWERCLYARTV